MPWNRRIHPLIEAGLQATMRPAIPVMGFYY